MTGLTETPPADPVLDDALISEEALWRIRLRLWSRSFNKNWEIFSRNRLGVVGVVLVAFFGFLAILHPILMATVWSDQVDIYDPVRGNDTVILEKTVVPDGEVTDPINEISFTEAMIFGNFFPEEGDVVLVGQAPAPPNSKHLLGTDPFGRDIMSQLMKTDLCSSRIATSRSFEAGLAMASIPSPSERLERALEKWSARGPSQHRRAATV